MVMPLEVRMRFGMWEEILSASTPPEHLPISLALTHYARGVAFAATNRTREARVEQARLRAAQKTIAKDAIFGNNTASDLLAIADRVLEGDILYREGKIALAIDALKKGAALEDALRYDEPPDWIQPVRHPLGAVLLAAHRYPEAEAVYRGDLAQRPNNGWALFGLHQSLSAQKDKKKRAEAVEVQSKLAAVWHEGEVPLASSCLCVGAH